MAALLGFLAAVFDFLAELFTLFARVVVFLAGIFKRLVVLLQLTLHAVELGLRFIQLFLPCLGAAVGFTEGQRRVGKRLLQEINLVALFVDRGVQNGVAGVQSGDAFVLFVKLRGHERHFGAQHLHGVVDVLEPFFELSFALDAQFQAERICQSVSPHIWKMTPKRTAEASPCKIFLKIFKIILDIAYDTTYNGSVDRRRVLDVSMG